MIRLSYNGKVWVRVDKQPISANIQKVLDKYKIPTHLTEVELYVTSVSEANITLIFSGLDAKGKRQYFYGEEYVKLRRQKKLQTFLHVHKYYNIILNDIDVYLSKNKPLTLTYTLYLALMFSTQTYIRTGLMKSLEGYGSTGLLTLKLLHVNIINSEKLTISFVGKDQVSHSFTIKSKYAVTHAKLIKDPNQFYFCYKDEDKVLSKITESQLYKFMRDKYDGIRIKDIRTYGANYIFINLISECLELTPKKTISKTIAKTAETIGHTKSICKSAYLVDEIIQYVTSNLELILKQKNKVGFVVKKFKSKS